jgi:hypothetical protein
MSMSCREIKRPELMVQQSGVKDENILQCEERKDDSEEIWRE